MTRAIWRSLFVAAVTIVVLESAAFATFAAFCTQHHAWQRGESGRSTVIRDTGYHVARPGDAIYACTTSHCFGPFACHDDLGCYCAAAAAGTAAIGQMVSGTCVLDQATPSLADDRGACRHARCDEHVGP